MWQKRATANLLRRADAMIAETTQLAAELCKQADEVAQSSPEEQAWMAWFMEQPPDVQSFIEKCTARGLRIDASNLEQALPRRAGHEGCRCALKRMSSRKSCPKSLRFDRTGHLGKTHLLLIGEVLRDVVDVASQDGSPSRFGTPCGAAKPFAVKRADCLHLAFAQFANHLGYEVHEFPWHVSNVD
jgi:hypothetical protein